MRASHPGMKRLLRGENILIALFLLLTLFYGYQTFSFQTVMMEDVVGPATFPRVIALGTIVLCGIYFYQARTASSNSEDEPSSLFEALFDLAPIGLTLAYVLLLEPLGFPVATFAFVALTMRYLGRSTKGSLAYALFLTLMFFGIFYFGLRTEIPMGRWIPLEEWFPFLLDLRDRLGG